MVISLLRYFSNGSRPELHHRHKSCPAIIPRVARHLIRNYAVGFGERTRLACHRWRLAVDFVTPYSIHFQRKKNGETKFAARRRQPHARGVCSLLNCLVPYSASYGSKNLAHGCPSQRGLPWVQSHSTHHLIKQSRTHRQIARKSGLKLSPKN